MPLMFLCFNVGDLLGRGLAGVGPWAKHSPPTPVLLVYAVARGGLLAALMLCNVITPHSWALPVLFRCAGVSWGSVGALQVPVLPPWEVVILHGSG